MKTKLWASTQLFLAIRATKAASPPCFSPSGTILPNYGVCDPRLSASLCCGSGDTCLSNGLCSTQLSIFYRGGCSDKEYQSGLCPSFCIDEPLTAFVSVCDHNGSAGGIHVCCDSGRTPGSCCKNTTEVFTLAAPFSSITAGPASPTGATTATTTGIPDSAATTTGLSSAAGPALQTSTAPDPARATSTAAPTANAHHGATIGAAVGGALGGGIVLSVLALLWYWRRRKSRNVQPKRPKISRPFELPSADPTFRPNSSLFPAELHHHVSALSLSPAELEYKDYKKSLGPAELEHKDSMTSTVRNELSAKTGEQAAGPYELPGMEIDAITEPPSPVRFDENRRWPFTRPEHVGDSNVEDSPSTPSGRKEKEAVLRKPSLRHRPGSMSGPWHDRF